MSDLTEARHVSRTQLMQWTLLLAAPSLWLVELNVMYWLVPLACRMQETTLITLSNLVFLALTLGIGLLAWRNWSSVGRAWPSSDDDDVKVQRSRFMAVMGLLSAGLFGLFIIANLLPLFVIPACLR